MRFCNTAARLVLGLFVLITASTLITSQAPAAEESPGKKLALLVGVMEYDHSQLNSLQFPENDVEELAEVLRAQKFQVVLLTTKLGKNDKKLLPTSANIRSELARLLKDATKHDVVLVGLAGHGIQPLGSDKAYFCPKDANPTIREGKGKDPSIVAFPDRLVGIDELLGTLDDSGVGQKLLLVDACRNDPNVRGRRGVDRVKVAALPPETGVLLSCSNGQFAFEHKSWGKGGHGAFFAAVIDGLNGHAGQEGIVTWETLGPYVRRQVPLMVQKVYGQDGGAQRPNLIANISEAAAVLATVTPYRPAKSDVSSSANLSSSPSEVEFPALAVAPFDAATAEKHQQAWAKYLKTKVETKNSIGMQLNLIPQGEFRMGRPESEEGYGLSKPRQMKIPESFYAGKYEVTQAEFRKIMDRNPSAYANDGPYKDDVKEFNTDRFPVEQVSWYDAIEFCNKLSEREGLPAYYSLSNVERNDNNGPLSIKKAEVKILGGRGYRLPTEAEWEFACRSGTTTPFHFGTVNNGREANCSGNEPCGTTTKGPDLKRPTTVGSYSANQFGLHDMHGNLAEWCEELDKDPYLPFGAIQRVTRGSSWNGKASWSSSGSRNSENPMYGSFFDGFRVVRTIPVPKR